MSTWVTHLMIADKLFEMGLDMDEVGFAIGSVGPDCNVENEDWTQYTPSREVTHWMTEKNNKFSTDYEGFYQKMIVARQEEFREHQNQQEYAFLFGYYAHLITDVEAQRFLRDEERTKNIFQRMKEVPSLYERVQGQPESFDTLKKSFGSRDMVFDFVFLERDYLLEHPDSRFETILRKTKSFPDYLSYLPQGAISRKLAVINQLYDFHNLPETTKVLVFISKNEFKDYLNRTSQLIYDKIQEKIMELCLMNK